MSSRLRQSCTLPCREPTIVTLPTRLLALILFPSSLSYSQRLYPSPTRGEGLILTPLARSGRGVGGEGHICARGLLTLQ